MAETIASIDLKYSGLLADESKIDFYDASQALIGFQRSLALTTHLVLTGEIITQAPALEGARILLSAPEEGSWKVTATILGMLGAGIYGAGTAPRDTPLGHMVSSAYDFVISETLGFHVDYDKSIGQQIEEREKARDELGIDLPLSKLDALVEKCEGAVKQMHRPIVASETAQSALITSRAGRSSRNLGPPLTFQTFEYLAYTVESDRPQEYRGRVSSYNINTFKGRIYVVAEARPIPFELSAANRDSATVRLVVESLSDNAQNRHRGSPNISFSALAYSSRSGRTKRLLVIGVRKILPDPP